MELTAQKWLSLPKDERQYKLRQLIAGEKDFDYINLVSAGALGVYASLGVHFEYAIFGRDSIQVAEDLLAVNKSLAHKIILTLASLQGVRYDDKSEEEPGKIHHEYRSKIFNNEPIPEVSLNIMKRLQQSWGDEASDSLRYYGSYDTTPLFIRLIGRYVQRYGQDILYEVYDGLDGEKRITDSLRAAINWLVGKIESSSWLMLEFKRINWDAGITNQAWKDSGTSYLHASGEMANHDSGIASAELQGYAYDALTVAAKLIARSDQESKDWLELARQLQQQTITSLWMPKHNFFAQGLDRSPAGQTRQIETLTSNGGLLLDSSLLQTLASNQQKQYIDAILNMLNGNEFNTPAGIRSRGLRHKDIPGFVDYHGSYTVWPKETYAIARGYRNFGFDKLASALESKILSSIMRSGEFYEFFYVNDDGRVWYDRDQAIEHFNSTSQSENLATPESGQAWTISAVEAILGFHNI